MRRRHTPVYRRRTTLLHPLYLHHHEHLPLETVLQWQIPFTTQVLDRGD